MKCRSFVVVGLSLAFATALPALVAAAESPEPSATATASASPAPTPTPTPTASPTAAEDPTPRSCGSLFPDIVHVGDVFEFESTFEYGGPEPFMVFRSDDGREVTHQGHPDAFGFFDLGVSFPHPIWIGAWTVDLYTGVPGEPPCEDRFTVVELATARLSPGAATPAAATPGATLPASSTDSTGRGAGMVARLLLILLGGLISIAAAATPNRRQRR